MNKKINLIIMLLSVLLHPTLRANEPSKVEEFFKPNDSWPIVGSVSAGRQNDLKAVADTNGFAIYNGQHWKDGADLVTRGFYGDTWLRFEYLLPATSRAQIYLQGRYGINLSDSHEERQLSFQSAGGIDSSKEDSDKNFGGAAPQVNALKPADQWQSLEVRFRAPRFDEARNKREDAFFIEIKINDIVVQTNTIVPDVTRETRYGWEDQYGPLIIRGDQGPIAIRAFDIRHADFSAVKIPAKSGESSNLQELTDFIELGEETFMALGCASCHAIKKDDSSVKSGPNLFGLFQRVSRDREVLGAEGNRFTIKADHSYLLKSIREPALQRAIVEVGTAVGEAYLPIMPPYSVQTVSDKQVDAIGAYLATLNDLQEQGPVIQLVTKDGPKQYDPMEDDLQLLVDRKTRIQRGPMIGASARAIHVGQTNGINYTFDPRVLAITSVWQGGFLDVSGELKNRGGQGLKPGFQSQGLEFGNMKFLLAPLNAKGQPIDFSFKEALFNDVNMVAKSLGSKQDHIQKLASVDARFLGYERDSSSAQSAPYFFYRVANNRIELQTRIDASGETTIHLRGEFKTQQRFSVNTGVLQNISASGGEFSQKNGIWTIPANQRGELVLRAKLPVAASAWRPVTAKFNYTKQKLQTIPATATLPAGYRIESYLPPRDNYGREQLFEALGLAVASDGTIVVSTRTAGIWRIVKGEWHLFAEGLFDSLGLVIEDKKGLQLVVGQKAELTRITDTNGDGQADKFETLFDAHSYHGNYHAYMHGPVWGKDGAYYITLNLAHSDEAIYKGGGMYMGSSGGFSGWAVRVTPHGEYELWANGLRSPAGLAVAPDGRLWYSDNQGEFVATSKISELKKGGFYGHPSSLVDLPGMTPDSTEIQWDKVSDKREKPAVLLPQNRLANSPGHPVWDTTKGRFGAFTEQMFIGDQTQSNLLRVTTEVVDNIEQGVAIPFASGLESGVMRPVFLPDGSLLLGQTGRGWQAKGGHVASLQRLIWDGKTVAPAILNMSAETGGFKVTFTLPIPNTIDVTNILQQISLTSWLYRDAPDYGSEVMDEHSEAIHSVSLSDDRKSLLIRLASTEQKQVHPQQTARVYHVAIPGKLLFGANLAGAMEAYYTLYRFPSSVKP